MYGIVAFWVLLAGVAALSTWMLTSPRTMWWRLTAWRYRHPEAHEPSGRGYQVMRFLGAVALAAAIFAACMAGAAMTSPPPAPEPAAHLSHGT